MQVGARLGECGSLAMDDLVVHVNFASIQLETDGNSPPLLGNPDGRRACERKGDYGKSGPDESTCIGITQRKDRRRAQRERAVVIKVKCCMSRGSSSEEGEMVGSKLKANRRGRKLVRDPILRNCEFMSQVQKLYREWETATSVDIVPAVVVPGETLDRKGRLKDISGRKAEG